MGNLFFPVCPDRPDRIELCRQTEKKENLFVTVYKKVIEENKYRNLDFYEARAIIKIYGEDQGLFHKGRSGNDILNLTKNSN